jgi:hypothetical protein
VSSSRWRLLATLTCAGLILAGCSDGDQPGLVAGIDIEQVCDDLESARTPLERRVVEADLFDALEQRADNVDDENSEDSAGVGEVIVELLETCPDEAAVMLGTDGPESLRNQVSLERTCTSEEASGTVTNESDQTLDIRVETQFYNADDVLLSSSQDSVRGLRAGQSGRWSNRYFGDENAARCLSRVTQAVPS